MPPVITERTYGEFGARLRADIGIFVKKDRQFSFLAPPRPLAGPGYPGVPSKRFARLDRFAPLLSLTQVRAATKFTWVWPNQGKGNTAGIIPDAFSKMRIAEKELLKNRPNLS